MRLGGKASITRFCFLLRAECATHRQRDAFHNQKVLIERRCDNNTGILNKRTAAEHIIVEHEVDEDQAVVACRGLVETPFGIETEHQAMVAEFQPNFSPPSGFTYIYTVAAT